MHRTTTSTTGILALTIAAMSLTLSGCGEQPQQPQPAADIYVNVRIPPPTIITRDVYLPTPAQRDGDRVCDMSGPKAPTTSQTASVPEKDLPVALPIAPAPAAPTTVAGVPEKTSGPASPVATNTVATNPAPVVAPAPAPVVTPAPAPAPAPDAFTDTILAANPDSAKPFPALSLDNPK